MHSFLVGNMGLATKKTGDICPNSIIESVGELGIVREFTVSLFVCQMLAAGAGQRVNVITQNDEFSTNMVILFDFV
ncbi:MAG: hypothetical protein D9V45_14755 [Chloroflexi bacterium]|nr:MAG: hypothetical protein D9V45_14755 [Chloroflexota bacterium]